MTIMVTKIALTRITIKIPTSSVSILRLLLHVLDDLCRQPWMWSGHPDRQPHRPAPGAPEAVTQVAALFLVVRDRRRQLPELPVELLVPSVGAHLHTRRFHSCIHFQPSSLVLNLTCSSPFRTEAFSCGQARVVFQTYHGSHGSSAFLRWSTK